MTNQQDYEDYGVFSPGERREMLAFGLFSTPFLVIGGLFAYLICSTLHRQSQLEQAEREQMFRNHQSLPEHLRKYDLNYNGRIENDELSDYIAKEKLGLVTNRPSTSQSLTNIVR